MDEGKMIPMKEKTLLGIYEEFDKWVNEDLACEKGCSTCCTQNVVITAVEGELIHRFIREHDKANLVIITDSRKSQDSCNFCR